MKVETLGISALHIPNTVQYSSTHSETLVREVLESHGHGNGPQEEIQWQQSPAECRVPDDNSMMLHRPRI